MRAAIGFVFCLCAFAQPRFEVASIKPSNAGPEYSGIKTGHSRLTATNVTLKRCIMGAYTVGPNQIFGGPDWLDSDRFNIEAKTELPTNDDKVFDAMLRTLLADRFHLLLHREPRTIQAYVLEVARGGPKLEKDDGGESKTDAGHGRLNARNTTMDHFAEVLSRGMDLPVVNRTGLDGVFHLKLEWTPENERSRPNAGPSIFTAVQEQLGLRLRAEKAPVAVLVIDRAEHPTEN
jgi:uncharacterized protein (TIGR03435 family)